VNNGQIPNSSIEKPKLFISYSWTNTEHQQWISDLVERLVQDGVDVKLDTCHLNTKGEVEEYFSAVAKHFESFRIACSDETKDTFDDFFIKSIEAFLPTRNKITTIFSQVSRYLDSDDASRLLRNFFEELIPYMYPPQSGHRQYRWDCDNYKFIIHELFLHLIADLLKKERFEVIASLLGSHYYVERSISQSINPMFPFTAFWNNLESLEHRNKRLGLGMKSLQTDLLMQRLAKSSVTKKQLIQSDFVLFLRGAFDSLANKTSYGRWYPVTLVYKEAYSDPIEIFARSQSKRYLEKMSVMFGVKTKEDFDALCSAFNGGKMRILGGNFGPLFDLKEILGIDRLSTLP